MEGIASARGDHLHHDVRDEDDEERNDDDLLALQV
jgi:hypothetical protein